MKRTKFIIDKEKYKEAQKGVRLKDQAIYSAQSKEQVDKVKEGKQAEVNADKIGKKNPLI